MKKICLTILMLGLLIIMGQTPIMAKEIKMNGGQLNNGENIEFIQVKNKSNLTFTNPISSITGKVFGVVAYICYGAAFIIIIIKGVQFMAAAPEGKAEIKKQMIAVVIGAFIIFSIREILIIISGLNLFKK